MFSWFPAVWIAAATAIVNSIYPGGHAIRGAIRLPAAPLRRS